MNPITSGVVGILVILFLMAIGMPIGFAMLLIGFVGFAYLVNVNGAVHILASVSYSMITNYDFLVLPLFILMAAICLRAGLGKSLFRLVYVFIGKMSGGLAAATIGACAFFAAASASSIATAVTMGSVAIPEMRRYNYDVKIAAGTAAAGGTLGILIPPSGVLIVYGFITQQSITKLFVGGILPGIILASLFILMIYIRAKINPKLAPAGPGTTAKEKLLALGDSAEMMTLLLLVIVGLIIGWFTPTEAGAIGAFGALLFSLIRRRLNWQGFKDSVIETIRETGMIFTIVIGAYVLNSFLAISTLPMELAGWVGGLSLPPILIMITIILVYMVLGCFVDSLTMIILTVPIFFPVVTSLGFDPIWFGIIIVLVAEMALITPPVGMNVYVISGVIKDIPMEDVFRGIIPFAVIMAVFIAFLVAFPQIATFLPGLSN